MYKKILIAIDGSDVAHRALDQGLGLAKAVGASVTIVTVTEPAALIGGGYASVAGTVIDPVPELLEALEAAAKGLLQDARKTAAAGGIEADVVHVDNSFPAEGIVETADRIGAELIVMGSHGRRGISRLILGSQTSNVLTHTKLPVLVTR